MTAALLLVLALQAPDTVQVGARLTDAEIHAGETTILRVDVQTDGARAQIGRFSTLPPGISVVSTRDYDQRQFSLPGGTRRFVTREFVLRAGAAGRYRIPSIQVVVEGQVYATRSALLTVTSAAARPRGETRGGEDGVMLRAWLDADTVFVGQQVTLEVEAMFSQDARMRLRRAPEYEAPSPSGFWVHELPDPGRPVSRSVGGEIYEVQRFRRAFFPLSAGRFTIPPARLEYEIRRGLLYAPETKALTSDALPLVVLPIPANQPPAFNGAVGDYRLRARVEPATVPVGEAAVLTVEVTGTGNVKALPAPELADMAGVDVFPPSQEAESQARGTTIQGGKTFSWVLIPRQSGEIEVPAIRYAFFNPAEGGFETATVGPLPLRVTAGATSAATPAPPTFRYVKVNPESDPLAWVRSAWFAALQALPLLLMLGVLLWQRQRERRGRVTLGGLRRERRQKVRELERMARDPAAPVFAEAESFARGWLSLRLDVPRTAIQEVETLRAVGVPEEGSRFVRAVLDRISSARYAPTPAPPAERVAIVAELARALDGVDRVAPGSRVAREGPSHRAAGGGTWVIALVAAGSLLGPGRVAAQGGESAGTPAFERGLAAFEDGRFDEAAADFDRYVGTAPGDPAGWYNLGTAYQQAGRPGFGVWAWLHAVRLDPRDTDARHNLRVAGVPPELVRRATPPLPLRSSELLLLTALAWLLAGTAGALWLLRRRRGLAVAAAGALAVAVTVGGVAWASTRDPRTLIVLDNATLRAGPALKSEAVSTLEPGTGLIPVDRYGDWVRARTLRGEEGWIESERTGGL